MVAFNAFLKLHLYAKLDRFTSSRLERSTVLTLLCNLLWLAFVICSITKETKREASDLNSTCAFSRCDLS